MLSLIKSVPPEWCHRSTKINVKCMITFEIGAPCAFASQILQDSLKLHSSKHFENTIFIFNILRKWWSSILSMKENWVLHIFIFQWRVKEISFSSSYKNCHLQIFLRAAGSLETEAAGNISWSVDEAGFYIEFILGCLSCSIEWFCILILTNIIGSSTPAHYTFHKYYWWQSCKKIEAMWGNNC